MPGQEILILSKPADTSPRLQKALLWPKSCRASAVRMDPDPAQERLKQDHQGQVFGEIAFFLLSCAMRSMETTHRMLAKQDKDSFYHSLKYLEHI